MGEVGEIERLVAPGIDAAGYDLVRVRFTGGGAPILQIMAERKDRRPVTVDDCATISRLVSALLDVEDPLSDAYVLEVSSPGIDRPLVRIGDYTRFNGFEAKLETDHPIGGQWRFRGRLKGVREDMVVIEVAGGDAEIPFAAVRRGSLVLTDELIAASMNEQGR